MLRKGGLAIQLQRIPDLPELHHMLSQALEKRGKTVSAIWRIPGKMLQFTLELTVALKGGDPHWSMFYEHAAKREHVFAYSSCDVLLVYNLILSSCTDILGPNPRAQGSAQGRAPNNAAPAKPQSQQARQPAPLTGELPSPAIAASFMKATELTKRDYGGTTGGAVSPASISMVPDSGDIATLPLPKLLQTIMSAAATGKLDVRNSEQNIVVFFKNGHPVDATATDTVGDDALIELLTWQRGHFTFEARVLRHSHTVHHSVDALLTQSKQYAEQVRQLEQVGMQPLSTFARLEEMDEMSFIQKLSRGTPTDMGTLGRFFHSLNGKQSLDELCRTMGHSRILTVHILHHLLTSGAIRINNLQGRSTQPSLTVQPRAIDGAAIQAVMMSLRRMDTGMFLYPAFLYFLEQEYFRTYRSRSALSVLVFEIRYLAKGAGGSRTQVLPGPAALDAVLRISQLKRHQDLLAHYDAFDYALLLPNTKSAGAQTFANRVLKVLTATPLAGGIEANQLSLAFGCASIPEDCTELTLLLGAADLAMNQAQRTKQALVMFRDIKHLASVKTSG